MKRFIAIALIGMFSFLMVGMVYASTDTKASIELKKDFDKIHLDFICDGITPSVTPLYGKMVTVLAQNVAVSDFVSDITPCANDPPLTKRRCE